MSENESVLSGPMRREVDDLINRRLAALEARLLERLAAAGQADSPAPLVDIRRACEHLDISETKLRGMCKAGTVPFYKIDGSYRFDVGELREALRARPALRKVG